MKVILIIENGKTKVVLRPENDFETDTIEKVFDKNHNYDISTEFKADYACQEHSDYRIEINITEKPKLNI